MAINLCKNQLSAPWKRRWEALDENQPCFDQEESAVLEAVEGLPVKYREVIHLYYVEGYSTAEIAALLGRGEGAVRVQLSRGRERLLDRALERAQRRETAPRVTPARRRWAPLAAAACLCLVIAGLAVIPSWSGPPPTRPSR